MYPRVRLLPFLLYEAKAALCSGAACLLQANTSFCQDQACSRQVAVGQPIARVSFQGRLGYTPVVGAREATLGAHWFPYRLTQPGPMRRTLGVALTPSSL